MIKAAFFDLDGTLFPSSTGQCSAQTRQALQKLHDQGVKLFAATGRAPYEFSVTNMLEGIPFDAYISLNGQFCYDENRVFYRDVFNKRDLSRAIDYLKEHPFPCGFVEPDYISLNFVNDRVRTIHEIIHTPPFPVREMQGMLDRDVLMLILYISKEELVALPSDIFENSTITRWNAYAVDIVPKGCSKRSGVECILKEYNISPDEAIAFGDGENDYEMLRYVKYGVAMGNSASILLSGDFYVTNDADQEGVVLALEHFKLI